MENQEGLIWSSRFTNSWETERDNTLRSLKWPCLWTVIPIRPGEDPSVKTSKEELTRGVVITYVDDLLLTGWQHHIDAITNALLAKYVMKKSGSLPYCESEKNVNGTSEGIDFLGARRMMPWQYVEKTWVK